MHRVRHTIGLAVTAIFALAFFCPPSRAENSEQAIQATANAASKDSAAAPPTKASTDAVPLKDSAPIKWSKTLNEGPDRLFYFAEAISGKKLKDDTYALMRGVTQVTISADKIVFHRIDNENLELGHDTAHGAKFFSDWEKSKINLESKFGQPGKDFLDSIVNIRLNGDRIEVERKGAQDTSVNLGERKLHHAFDLRELRLRQLSMLVDSSSKNPSLKDISGITAVIKAPGLSFPVDIKEFGKVRLEKENDITVGVRNPVPGPVRAILFLPGILRFHFLLARKEK